LSRLVSEEGAFQAAARKALEVMHYDLASLAAAAISGPSALLNCDSAWKIDPLRRGIGVQN
jgi:hypothetical protein